MRETECEAHRRLLDGRVFGENAFEQRWVEWMVLLNRGGSSIGDGQRMLERASARSGHISPKAHDLAKGRVPEEEPGCDCWDGLVGGQEIAGGIVRELGLHVQPHDVEICPHVTLGDAS
jgi:hypothetical protein